MQNVTSRMHKYFRRYISGQLIFDTLSWFASIFAAALLRYDFNFESIDLYPLLATSCLAALLQVSIGLALHLYRGRYKIATFDELKSLLAVVGLVSAPMAALSILFGPIEGLPRSTFIIAAPIFLALTGSVRVFRRYFALKKLSETSTRRTLIYGAGQMAEALLPQLFQDPSSAYLPVGLIDDSPGKSNRWINGVPMLGTWKQIKSIAEETGAEVVIVCIARSDAGFLKKVESDCRALGLRVIVFPALNEILQEKVTIRDLRSLSIEDLVGRRTLDTRVDQISSYLEGKTVLVTGAGGSIGSELCKQISRYKPHKLILLDRDETGLQLTQLGVSGHGLLDTNDVVLADIRDKKFLMEIFKREKPEVVFHAAALKHLPLLEQFPDEAWKTNVLGTLNVLQASQAQNVKTFVNISTDKAADPTSVLGKSKKVTEGLTSWFADETNCRYLSVRFGNVLGSRGSLLPTFASLIEQGGPVTVTHKDVTRFFMSIPEACQLVLQAGAIGKPKDVLILDMGEPVRILDIANRMIAISGREIEIVFTGLRAGEKLHEDLYSSSEVRAITEHDLISRASVQPLNPQDLNGLHIK